MSGRWLIVLGVLLVPAVQRLARNPPARDSWADVAALAVVVAVAATCLIVGAASWR